MQVDVASAENSVTTDEQPSGAKSKTYGLENLIGLLLGARNAAASGAGNLQVRYAAILGSAVLDTSALMQDRTKQVLFFNVIGLLFFLGAFLADYSAGKAIRKRFSGKNTTLSIGFTVGCIGASVVSTQMSKAAVERSALALQAGIIMMAFCGFSTNQSNVSTAKTVAKFVRQRLQRAETQRDLQNIQQTMQSQPVSVKALLEKLMQLVVSFRNLFLVGGIADLKGSADANTVDAATLKLNYALVELFFGSAVLLFLGGAFISDKVTQRIAREGWLKTVHDNVSGVKLQICIAGFLSIAGGLLLLLASDTSYYSGLSFLCLVVSGFFTGPSKIAGFVNGSDAQRPPVQGASIATRGMGLTLPIPTITSSPSGSPMGDRSHEPLGEGSFAISDDNQPVRHASTMLNSYNAQVLRSTTAGLGESEGTESVSRRPVTLR